MVIGLPRTTVAHRYPTRYSQQRNSRQERDNMTENLGEGQEESTIGSQEPNAGERSAMARPRKLMTRKIEVLDTLEPKQVAEFQHAFKYTTTLGTRKQMMTREVLEAIHADGVDISDEQAISDYLNQIVDEDIKGNVRNGFKYMKENLKWPDGEKNIRNKINSFIRRAQFLKRYLKGYATDERLQEDVFHMIRKKLPKPFGITRETIREDRNLLQLAQLGEELKRRSWALELKHAQKSKTRRNAERRIIEKLKEKGLISDDEGEDLLSDTDEEIRKPKKSSQKNINRVKQEEIGALAGSPTFQDLVEKVNNLHATMEKPRCFECGSLEHFRAACPLRQKSNVQPQTAQSGVIQGENMQQLMQFMRTMMEAMRGQSMSDAQNPNGRNVQYTPKVQNYQKEKKYIVNRLGVGTVMPRAQIQARNPGGVWTNVRGILDSGSGTTVGSIQHHKHLFPYTRPVRNIVRLQLINKEEYLAKEVGHLRIRVIDATGKIHEFQEAAMVFLVDSPSWDELIIGYPTLKAQGLLPEQTLTAGRQPQGRNAPEPRDN